MRRTAGPRGWRLQRNESGVGKVFQAKHARTDSGRSAKEKGSGLRGVRTSLRSVEVNSNRTTHAVQDRGQHARGLSKALFVARRVTRMLSLYRREDWMRADFMPFQMWGAIDLFVRCPQPMNGSLSNNDVLLQQGTAPALRTPMSCVLRKALGDTTASVIWLTSSCIIISLQRSFAVTYWVSCARRHVRSFEHHSVLVRCHHSCDCVGKNTA